MKNRKPVLNHIECTSYAHCIHLRKEVIQPHLPVRLPCYDLTPVTDLTLGASLIKLGQRLRVLPIHGLTGGVYNSRERIHRVMLIRDY